jgi:hypothetical protein
MIATQTTHGGSSGMGAGRPGMNGSGRRLVHTRHRAAPLIFYPGRFGTQSAIGVAVPVAVGL